MDRSGVRVAPSAPRVSHSNTSSPAARRASSAWPGVSEGTGTGTRPRCGCAGPGPGWRRRPAGRGELGALVGVLRPLEVLLEAGAVQLGAHHHQLGGGPGLEAHLGVLLVLA